MELECCEKGRCHWWDDVYGKLLGRGADANDVKQVGVIGWMVGRESYEHTSG